MFAKTHVIKFLMAFYPCELNTITETAFLQFPLMYSRKKLITGGSGIVFYIDSMP